MTPARKVELANEMIDLVYARVDRDGELEDFRRQECLNEIVSMIQAIECETWLAAALMIDELEIKNVIGLTNREKLRVFDVLGQVSKLCRQQAEAAR